MERTENRSLVCAKCGGTDARHYRECTHWAAIETTVIDLRDQFAMAAMGGYNAAGISLHGDFARCADECYAFADAMLKAREPKS